MKWGAIIAGAMGLAVLEAVVSSQQAAGRVGGWLQGAGKVVDGFISPSVPAFNSGSNTPGPSHGPNTVGGSTPYQAQNNQPPGDGPAAPVSMPLYALPATTPTNSVSA